MQGKQIKILFLCLGNICRSPAGENVFRQKVSKLKFIYPLLIDSAGVIASNGNSIDHRIYSTNGSSRRLTKKDVKEFDYILAMDQDNYQDAISLGGGENVKLLMQYTGIKKDVFDPYYGGQNGFDDCLNMIEQGCDAFIEFLKKEKIIID